MQAIEVAATAVVRGRCRFSSHTDRPRSRNGRGTAPWRASSEADVNLPEWSKGTNVGDLIVKPLDMATWDAFVDLVDRDGGVWGGCWCLEFHPEGRLVSGYEERREQKQRLVECGRAQAALVFDGDLCVGWCQFGSTEELQKLLYGEPTKINVEGVNLTYEGVIPKIQKSMLRRQKTFP
jgi:hypothetical protein